MDTIDIAQMIMDFPFPTREEHAKGMLEVMRDKRRCRRWVRRRRIALARREARLNAVGLTLSDFS